MKSFGWIGLAAVGWALSGCSGSAVDVGGDSPQAASEEVASALCARQAECGEVVIGCTGDGCEGTIRPVDYDTCYDGQQPYLESTFACLPDDGLATMINDCYNALLSRSCVTQAELDAFVAEVNAGTAISSEAPWIPASCRELDLTC